MITLHKNYWGESETIMNLLHNFFAVRWNPVLLWLYLYLKYEIFINMQINKRANICMWASVEPNSRSDHTGYYCCTSYTEESVEMVVYTSLKSCGYIKYPNSFKVLWCFLWIFKTEI